MPKDPPKSYLEKVQEALVDGRNCHSGAYTQAYFTQALVYAVLHLAETIKNNN